MKGKVLVTGAQGLVGSRFVELYRSKFELLTPDLSDFDFLNVPLMKKYLKVNKVEGVINFAAFTDVTKAEPERGNKNGPNWKINVTGLRDFIKLLPKSTYFIQISTDMVFPGSADDPGPYEEDHKLTNDPSKLTWYGYSKAMGEKMVSEYFKNFAILRLIAPVRAKFDQKLDLLRKHLDLYNEGKLYPLFDDQTISISFIDEISLVLKKLLENRISGIFHASSTDTNTPFELISYLIEAKYAVKDAVKSNSIHEFMKTTEHPLRYPIFGGLKADKTQKMLNIKFSSTHEIINKLIEQGL